MTQLNDLDYEAIENAVLETARGRWFLNEYKKRNGVAGTETLLDAIGRLEKVISSINTVSAPAPAKPAIEPVVAAVATMPEESGKTEQSEKKAETAPVKSTPAAAPAATPAPELTDNNLQFFSNDEDLFADDANSLLPDPIQTETVELTAPAKTADKPEAKPAEKPAKKAKSPAEVDEKQEKSANDGASRVKIVRSSPKAADEKPVEKKAAEKTPTAPDPVMTPTVEEQDRIVIIRKSASSDVEIPLADGLSLDDTAKPAVKPV